MPPNLTHNLNKSTVADQLLAATLTQEENEEDDFFLHDIENAQGNVDRAPNSNIEETKDTSSSVKRILVSENPQLHREEEEEYADPSIRIRKFVKKYSSFVSSPGELSIDNKRLVRTIRDVGEYAYGVHGIAVWIFDEDQHRLVQPEGGWWHDPNLPQTEALERLINGTHPNYVPPTSVAPGIDIAGLLWLESSNWSTTIGSFMRTSVSGTSLNRNVSTDTLNSVGVPHHMSQLVWRDLVSLLEDPDTSKGPRLELMIQAGFAKAAGIRFQTEVNQGMVIFLSGEHLDPELLACLANTAYVRQAAQFIGAAAAMSDVRRACRAHQDEVQKHSVSSFIEEQRGSQPEQPITSPDTTKPLIEESSSLNCCAKTSIPHRLKVWKTKVQGGGMQIPPALSYRQALWTTFGAFCGLLVLSSLNEYYKYLSDGEYLLLIGPFGALMTLQYGLTAAPASQPRNAILGQAVAGAVSLAFTYIPESVLSTWLRRAMGPAVGIGVMVKCGFTHPPAGAHAVLYASGNYNFAFYALVVLSTVVSVIPATVVNNMSIKRQYPTYWGVPNWIYSYLHENGLLADNKTKNG